MATTTKTRQSLALEVAITFYVMHTAADRALARALVIAAGATGAYQTPGGVIAFTNAAGRVVAYLHPTYVTVLETAAAMPAKDRAAGRPMKASGHEGRGWDVYLSTYTDGRSDRGAAKPEARRGATCPTCFEDMALNGNPCFNCT